MLSVFIILYVMNASTLPALSVTTWWISSYKEQQVRDTLQHGNCPNRSRCGASHIIINTQLKVYCTSELRRMKKS